MKLTYWISECLDDSPAYNIRDTTKKAVLAQRELQSPGRWGEAFKVEVQYADAFDLMEQCMSEGSGFWECPPLPI